MAGTQLQSTRWVREYRQAGFVRIQGFFSAEDIQEIRDAIARYLRDTLPNVPITDRVLESDGISVRNLWRMEIHSEFFRKLSKRPTFSELLPEFLNGNPVCTGVETFNKPARVGSGVPWHQDNAYFCLTPADSLTVWVALDPVTVENGAVRYLRGSHRHGLFAHATSGVQGNSMQLAGPPPVDGEECCATLEPGDVIFHHCQVLHRSEPNRTSKPRCGLLLVFRGEHTKEDPSLKTDYRKALETTLKA
jgi:hypothetical protein